jgi:hypothetical protein
LRRSSAVQRPDGKRFASDEPEQPARRAPGGPTLEAGEERIVHLRIATGVVPDVHHETVEGPPSSWRKSRSAKLEKLSGPFWQRLYCTYRVRVPSRAVIQ